MNAPAHRDDEPCWDGSERRHEPAGLSQQLARLEGKVDSLMAGVGALSAAQAAADARLRAAEVGLAEVRARQQDQRDPKPQSQWPAFVAAISAAVSLVLVIYNGTPAP